MFLKLVHLDGRDSFILGYDDIDDECIQPIIRNLHKHISSETTNRLSTVKRCLSWIRWAQLVKKEHPNDSSDQM